LRKPTLNAAQPKSILFYGMPENLCRIAISYISYCYTTNCSTQAKHHNAHVLHSSISRSSRLLIHKNVMYRYRSVEQSTAPLAYAIVCWKTNETKENWMVSTHNHAAAPSISQPEITLSHYEGLCAGLTLFSGEA